MKKESALNPFQLLRLKLSNMHRPCFLSTVKYINILSLFMQILMLIEHLFTKFNQMWSRPLISSSRFGLDPPIKILPSGHSLHPRTIFHRKTLFYNLKPLPKIKRKKRPHLS